MNDEQKESIRYAADWLARSEDIGNQKHAERLRSVIVASASAEPVATNAPFSNCQFRECDLPGQCKGEGKCHHPAAPRPIEAPDNPQPVIADTALPDERIDWLANAHCPGGVAYPNQVKTAIREALREARIADTATKYEGMFARRASEPEYAYVIDALIAAGHISQSKVDDAFALAKKHVIADTAGAKPCEVCDGVGKIGTPGQRCFGCEGSGQSKFASPAIDAAPDNWQPSADTAKPDDEAEKYKRMFLAACSDLGLINEALGLDPDAGGAAPILEAIEDMKYQEKLLTERSSNLSERIVDLEKIIADRSLAAPAIDAAPTQADLPCPTCGGEVAKRFNSLKDDNSQADDSAWQIMMLSAAARSGDPKVIELTAQLVGAAPCEKCGFLATKCRCVNSQAVALSERITQLQDALETALEFIADATITEGQWHWVEEARAALSAPASMNAENRPAQDDVRDAQRWRMALELDYIPTTWAEHIDAAIASQSAKELAMSNAIETAFSYLDISHPTVREALAEIEELRRDAQRYRWLRTQQAQRADDYDNAVDTAIAKYEKQIASQPAKEPKK